VLLTKADKLGRGRGLTAQRALQAEFPGVGFQLFSGRTGTGVEQARERITAWLLEGIKKGPGV
jgi:GTP-binding protein